MKKGGFLELYKKEIAPKILKSDKNTSKDNHRHPQDDGKIQLFLNFKQR